MKNPKHTSAAVSAAIRAEMAARRVLVRDVLKQTGMAPNSWQRRMAGDTAWTVDELRQVAPVIGTTATSLLERAEVLDTAVSA